MLCRRPSPGGSLACKGCQGRPNRCESALCFRWIDYRIRDVDLIKILRLGAERLSFQSLSPGPAGANVRPLQSIHKSSCPVAPEGPAGGSLTEGGSHITPHITTDGHLHAASGTTSSVHSAVTSGLATDHV